jgi:tetratricopeptide (TPR) repeat protein
MAVRNIAVILIGLLVFGLSSSACAEPASEEIEQLFAQANKAFKEGNLLTTVDPNRAEKLYERAVLGYERIINQGQVRNAMLYYNLGNAYFLKEDIGRAILNYRRAEKLDGANADIKKNLAFARSRRVDIVNPRTEKRVLKTLFFWHYDFSLKTRFVLMCIGFGVVCICLSAVVWFGRLAPASVTAVICGVLTGCFFVSVVVETSAQARQVCGVIVAEEVVAHQADWRDSPPSFKDPLHAGTEFELIERRSNWLHVRLLDGNDGWIPQTSAEIV